MLLEGKIALITGATGGIGSACAMTFAKEGAEVVLLVDVNEQKASAIMEKLRGITQCAFLKADVTDEETCGRIFEKITMDYGRLDILANCAGINNLESLFEMKTSTWDHIMNINLKGVMLYSKAALRLMSERGYGKVISIASISGQVGGIRTSPAYAVSKAGIMCLTKSLAKAVAKSHINVNAVAPGIIATEMVRVPGFVYSESEVPMGYIGSPEEVADVMLFLASDLSRYVTGQCIHVNGGMYMA